MAIFRREPPFNGDVGVGRNRDSEPTSGFTACYQSCDQPGVLNMTRTTVPQVVTLIAGSKQQCLLMAGDGDEMCCDKKSQRYAKDNRTALNCMQ